MLRWSNSERREGRGVSKYFTKLETLGGDKCGDSRSIFETCHTMIKLHFISVYKVNPKSIITPNIMMKTAYNDCYCVVSAVVSKLINLYNLLSQICLSIA